MPKRRFTAETYSHTKAILAGIGLVVVFALRLMPLQAQTPSIVLSLALPEVMRQALSETVIADFEAANPGVRLYLTDTAAQITTSPVSQPDEYVAQVERYVSTADVLFASTATLYPDATLAGYFLDLMPLVAADSDFSADDFYPAVWESARWDGGLWLIPAAASVYLLNYDLDAFDRAGLPYPTADWTFDDFANAARALTVRDNSGQVVIPGFATGFLGGRAGLLLRSLTGTGFADDTTTPPAPRLATPELISLLEQYAALEADTGISSAGQYDVAQITLAISPPWWFAEGRRWGVSLLPGGGAGVVANGFAVSAGTQYPELAYRLALYLSQRPEIVAAFFGDSPAHRTLPTVQTFPPEVQAVIDQALLTGFPSDALRYAEFLDVALAMMQAQGGDALIALQAAETEATSVHESALAKRGKVVISVAPPPPEIVAAPDEIVLQYGMAYSVTPLPNRADWTRVMDDFAAADPDVAQIEMNDLYEYDSEVYTSRFDCFYMPDTSGMWPGVLDLSPLLNADPDFDSADVIGGVLAQFRVEGQIFAYPVTIQPRVLWVKRAQFEAVGLPIPEDGWTVQDFNTALVTIDDGRPTFSPLFETVPLLMLVASYGGMPLDFSTKPPTPHFTEQDNADAIRQVLDLAKAGQVNYTALADGTANFPFFEFVFEDPNPIYTDTLNIMSGRFSQFRSGRDLTYALAFYPAGEFTPASFNVGAAFISADAPNPEACYRWLKTIAAHPELFQAMPARRSLLDNPVVMAAQGESTAAFYARFADLLEHPNTTVFPSSSIGYLPENHFPLLWLFRAMDRYVYEGADLDAELADAQTYVKAFGGCFEGLAPYGSQERRLQVQECALRLDPSLSVLFEET